MTAVLASIGLIACGFGCFWVVGHTPKNTPVWFDGPFLLGAFALWVAGIVGLLRAAF